MLPTRRPSQRLSQSSADEHAIRPGSTGSTSSANGSVLVYPEFLDGCNIVRVTRRKSRNRVLSIDPETGAIILDRRITKFVVDQLRDLRSGTDASHYRELCKVSSDHVARWLSMVYSCDGVKLKVLNIICPSEALLDRLIASLKHLSQRRLDLAAQVNLLGRDAGEEGAWTSLARSTKDSTCMTFEEVEALCLKMHLNAPLVQMRRAFREFDEGTGKLSFDQFKLFIDRLKVRHDVETIYNSYKAGAVMTSAEFASFLTTVQEHDDIPQLVSRASTEGLVTPASFNSYLHSRQNTALRSQPQDMTRPLHEYFISSSHNTYLTGKQVADESSVELYIRSLQRVCRSVEVDVWENSHGQPEVRHGRAWTTSVSIESVLKAIEKYAFITSPWPLIISLEIRCGLRAQEILVKLIKDILGDLLALDVTDAVPSPETLRHQIVLKVKNSTSARNHDDDSSSTSTTTTSAFDDTSLSAFDEMSSTSPPRMPIRRASAISSKPSVAESLLALAPLMQGIKFRNFSLPESKTTHHIFSLSESTLKDVYADDSRAVLKHNTRHMMRTYPKRSRLWSSNFEPHHFWSMGVQQVALNWQTHDLGMQLNSAFFATDEGDPFGYRLKPAHMRYWPKSDEKQPVFDTLRYTITIVSGQQLPRAQLSPASARLSPFVEIEVIRPPPRPRVDREVRSVRSLRVADTDGRPLRETRFRSPTVDGNGFNPRFDAKFGFTLHSDEDAEFCFVKFSVRDAATSGEPATAQYVANLPLLRRGYHALELHDLNGEQLIFSSLLVRIESRKLD